MLVESVLANPNSCARTSIARGFSASDASLALARVLRVLVVDDVAMNLDIAASFIRSAGHEVACVEGGAAAVEAVATTDFDVVLMDIMMPEVNGLEATRRIRALGGPRGRVPIVAMTVQAFSEQPETYLGAGMDGHVVKPFTPESLLTAVTRGVAEGQLAPASFFRLS
jgi:CheY-like chemotaxis protein